jgi:cytochrome c biogenesis protein CcdA
VYLASLGLVALAAILLVAPAAWHRFLRREETCSRFRRVAGGMLLIAMGVLALALSGDVYVAATRIARFSDRAAMAAAATGLFFYILWFAIPLLRRGARATGERTFERGGTM